MSPLRSRVPGDGLIRSSARAQSIQALEFESGVEALVLAAAAVLVEPVLVFEGLLDALAVPVSVGGPSLLYSPITAVEQALDALG